jgi:ATP-dependent Clp protease protease subunit
MKKFWEFKAKENIGELYLYGDISNESWWGDEITPKQFKDDLEALGDIDELRVYINSGGGDVFAGWNIINILNRHKARKIGYNDGLAASIAFDILMSMDKVIASENSMFMTHNCWTLAIGNRHDLREMADTMEKIDGMLAETASKRSGKTVEEMLTIQDAESWYTAKEAIDEGFADELDEAKKIAASIDGDFLFMNDVKFDITRYKHIELPKSNLEQEVANNEETENRGESEPVSDILSEQEQKFKNLKLKLLMED